MSVSANKARLAGITRELSLQWEQTKEHWSDEKSRQFEQQYIEPLLTSVDSAMDVVDQMDKLIAKIKNDCE